MPGGEGMALTKENRKLFVKRYLHWILVESVEKQFKAFRWVGDAMMPYPGSFPGSHDANTRSAQQADCLYDPSCTGPDLRPSSRDLTS